MIKLLEVIGRRPDFTHEQFIDYQLHGHLDVISGVPEFVKPVRRYMQNHLVLDPERLSELQGFPVMTNTDSIIEVWYDNIEAAKQAFGQPRYMEIIRPDELSFGDVEGVWGVVAARENTVIDNEAFTGQSKLFVFLKRASQYSRGEFTALWRESLERALKAVEGSGKPGRIIENWTDDDPAARLPGMRDFDLVAELWFQSLADTGKYLSNAATRGLLLQAEFLGSPGLAYVGVERPEAREWLKRQQR